MPTLVDSLIVELSLDIARYLDKMKEVDRTTGKAKESLTRHGKGVEGAAKGMVQAFSGFASKVLSFVNLIESGKAFVQFMNDIAKVDLVLGRVAYTMGVSVTTLGTFQGAAKLAGGTAEGMAGGLDSINMAIQQFKFTGESPLIPWARALQIDLFDANGEFKKATEIADDMGEKLRKLKPEEAKFAALQMGMPEDMLTYLLKSKAEQERFKAIGARYAPTDEDVRAGALLVEKVQELGLAWMKAGRDIATEFTPELAAAYEWSTKLVNTLKSGLDESVKNLSDRTKKVTDDWIAIEKFFFGNSKYEEWMNSRTPKGPVFGEPGKGTGAFRGTMPDTGAVAGNADAIISYFMSKGWTKDQAAGIAANLSRESNFKTNLSGDAGQAYGIAQWHPDRQADFSTMFGHDIRQSTLEEQLAFIHHELTEGKERAAGAALRAAGTAQEAGSVVSRTYERPANMYGEATARGSLAQGYAAAFNRNTSNTNNTTSTSITVQNLNVTGTGDDAKTAGNIRDALMQVGKSRVQATMANSSN